MVPSFRIRNFRLFDAIDIEHLTRVNLVVGKNNAGKTCLLEALRVHGDDASPECLRRVLRGRAEDRPEWFPEFVEDGPDDGRDTDPLMDPIRSLFHGYQLPLDGSAIELGPCEGAAPGSDAHAHALRLSLAAFSHERRGDETIERRVDMESADEDTVIRLVVERKDHAAKWSLIRQRRLHRKARVLRESEPLAVRFVGTNTYESEETLEYWRHIAVRPSARTIVEDALRLIDPEIKEVVVLPHPRRAGEVILIYSDVKRLPLRSLGDGIQRLFQIMLAMVARPGGLVLIDEFENGLHWSVQRLAWELLLGLAEDLDVQLVATTHSWDCIAAFRDVVGDRGSETGQLIHLGRSIRKSTSGSFVSVLYDGETLKQVTQAGLEVRG